MRDSWVHGTEEFVLDFVFDGEKSFVIHLTEFLFTADLRLSILRLIFFAWCGRILKMVVDHWFSILACF